MELRPNLVEKLVQTFQELQMSLMVDRLQKLKFKHLKRMDVGVADAEAPRKCYQGEADTSQQAGPKSMQARPTAECRCEAGLKENLVATRGDRQPRASKAARKLTRGRREASRVRWELVEVGLMRRWHRLPALPVGFP